MDVFIPTTTATIGNDKKYLLLLNSYRSYVIVEFIYIAWTNNIYIIYLLSYSSYILQPLDLYCFSPIKSIYRKYIVDLV